MAAQILPSGFARPSVRQRQTHSDRRHFSLDSGDGGKGIGKRRELNGIGCSRPKMMNARIESEESGFCLAVSACSGGCAKGWPEVKAVAAAATLKKQSINGWQYCCCCCCCCCLLCCRVSIVVALSEQFRSFHSCTL